MSTLKTNNVQVGQSGTATNNFTLYQPSTPDGTVRLGNGNSGSVTDVASFTSAGVFSFNSGYGSVAPAYGCRAWVNFNGTGTVAINGSGNVTSITDNGTGDYTVNFTAAMPDANYCAALGGQFDVAAGTGNPAFFGIRSSSGTVTTKTTSALRLSSATYAGSVTDVANLNVAIFR